MIQQRNDLFAARRNAEEKNYIGSSTWRTNLLGKIVKVMDKNIKSPLDAKTPKCGDWIAQIWLIVRNVAQFTLRCRSSACEESYWLRGSTHPKITVCCMLWMNEAVHFDSNKHSSETIHKIPTSDCAHEQKSRSLNLDNVEQNQMSLNVKKLHDFDVRSTRASFFRRAFGSDQWWMAQNYVDVGACISECMPSLRAEVTAACV